MICPACNKPAARMIYRARRMACANCWGVSEAAGAQVDGANTRNSFRIREQQRRFEADMIPPHTYDKASKKVIPNPDFIKLYPDKIDNYFEQTELEQAGYDKIGHAFQNIASQKQKAQHDASEGVTFKGS